MGDLLRNLHFQGFIFIGQSVSFLPELAYFYGCRAWSVKGSLVSLKSFNFLEQLSLDVMLVILGLDGGLANLAVSSVDIVRVTHGVD